MASITDVDIHGRLSQEQMRMKRGPLADEIVELIGEAAENADDERRRDAGADWDAIFVSGLGVQIMEYASPDARGWFAKRGDFY